MYLPFFSISGIIKSKLVSTESVFAPKSNELQNEIKRLSLAFSTELGTNTIHSFISSHSQALTNTTLITFLFFLLQILTTSHKVGLIFPILEKLVEALKKKKVLWVFQLSEVGGLWLIHYCRHTKLGPDYWVYPQGVIPKRRIVRSGERSQTGRKGTHWDLQGDVPVWGD